MFTASKGGDIAAGISISELWFRHNAILEIVPRCDSKLARLAQFFFVAWRFPTKEHSPVKISEYSSLRIIFLFLAILRGREWLVPTFWMHLESRARFWTANVPPASARILISSSHWRLLSVKWSSNVILNVRKGVSLVWELAMRTCLDVYATINQLSLLMFHPFVITLYDADVCLFKH